MSNTENDPGASTQQFRAYKEGTAPNSGAKSTTGRNLAIGIVLVVAAVVVIVALLLR